MDELKPKTVATYRLLRKDTVLDLDRPIKAAIEVLENAYTPYSNFRVGTALITRDGSMFTGCNVEFADCLVTHAEVSAISAMTVAGKRNPIYLVVVGAFNTEDSQATPVSVCAGCRQKLMEFAQLSGSDLRIIVGWNEEAYEYKLLSDWYPDAFGPKSIGIDLSKYGGK